MRTLRPRDRYGLRHRSVFVRAVMTRPTALRKSALEGRGIVVLLLPSSSSSGVVLRAVVVPHLVSRESSIHFLSLSLALSLRETQKTAPPSRDRGERRRCEVVGCLRSLSLSLSLSLRLRKWRQRKLI